jgi:tetratricopeptide (TPR) repeat protein
MKRKTSTPARHPGAIAKSDTVVKIQMMMAMALREYNAGHMTEAERFCLQVLALDVHHADALYMLGMAAFKTERFVIAERMIRRAIAINGRQAYYYSNLGNTLKALGKTEDAIACFRKAIEIQPSHSEACYNLANVLLTDKKLDESEALYKQALAVNPEYADALCNLGTVYRMQNRFDEAVDCFRRALKISPDNPDLCCNLGDALHMRGDLEEAVRWYMRTVELKPEHPKVLNCLCNVHFDLGNLPESVEWCNRALALRPDFGDALMNRSLLQLLQGDFANGWRNYEVRWSVYPPRAFTQPQWQGQPLNGASILLYAEQGLGDSLQFLRYVPLVQAAGGHVMLDLPINLRRLAAQIPGLAANFSTGETLPQFDFRCPMLSLPLACGTTLETIPARVPYLVAPQEALAKAASIGWSAEGLRVGVAWTGNPTHPKNRARSVPLDMLASLFDLEGVHFYSLQMGVAEDDLVARKTTVVDLAPVTSDMADTAAQMAYLDLVISIDTSMAHLAGALGRPLWVLLSKVPDWRWLLEREDCPWYPSARLIRQTVQNEWGSVIERVRVGLVEMAARKQAKLAQLRGAQAQTAPPQAVPVRIVADSSASARPLQLSR